jgi:phosphohistidine swiveling domain-containing protein
MMEAFDRLRHLPAPEREAGLTHGLARHGHRGPLESDPARPRFGEIRERLAAELAMGGGARAGRRVEPPRRARLRDWAFFPDRLRERFRDELMRLWQVLRERALELGKDAVASGRLARADEVFLLAGEDLDAPPSQWRERVAQRREARERHEAMTLPVTSDLDALARCLVPEGSSAASRGIGIGRGIVRGRVRRARELDEVLGLAAHEPEVLVVPSLEPSWAVVFPRFVAVVSELGGELSHAAILLRESRRRAVVDCRGIFASARDGELVEVDPERGLVTRCEAP